MKSLYVLPVLLFCCWGWWAWLSMSLAFTVAVAFVAVAAMVAIFVSIVDIHTKYYYLLISIELRTHCVYVCVCLCGSDRWLQLTTHSNSKTRQLTSLPRLYKYFNGRWKTFGRIIIFFVFFIVLIWFKWTFYMWWLAGLHRFFYMLIVFTNLM